MAAEHEDAVGGAREREPLVAGGVDLLDRTGALEGAAQERPRLLPRRRPGDALGAVGVAGQLSQLLQIGDGAAWIERHGGEDTTVRGL